MQIPDLSIIIVSFNNSREINRCLQSIRIACKDLVTEVIIVDNYSQDNTVAIIKTRMATDAGEKLYFHLIENGENRGFAKACNQGFKRCRGEYILLLNPDTVVLSDAILKLVHFLQGHPQAGIVAPQLLFADGRVQPSVRRFPTHRDVFFELLGLSRLFPKSRICNRWKMGDFDHTRTTEVDQPQGACLMTHRKVLKDIGFMDEQFEMFFNDVDWCKRCKQKGWKIYFYPEAKVVHFKGTSVYRNRPEMIWASHRAFYLYLNKHSPHTLNLLVGLILIISGIIRASFHKILS